jgi:hypothetical protein
MGVVYDYQAAAPILKQRYETQEVLNGFFEDFPLLADLEKDEGSGGGFFQINVKLARMSTRNATVPGALGNGSPDQYFKFNIPTLYNDYAVAQLAGPAVDNASVSEDATITLLTEAMDGAYGTAYESQAIQVMNGGGGMRGQVNNTTFTGTVINLVNVGDAVKFWDGQVLQVSKANDDGAGGLGITPTTPLVGSLTVAGVDYQVGTVTVTTALSTGVPSIAQFSGLFMTNDYGTGFPGLGAWNPYTAPTSTIDPMLNYIGGNAGSLGRTANTVGLSGWRFTGGGASYVTTMTNACARMNSIGAKMDRCYLNPIDWGQFANTQNNLVFIDKAKTPSQNTPTLSFETLTFMTSKGALKIMGDITLPQGYARLLELKHLTLRSNGKICRPANNWIGKVWMPSFTDDIVQARLVTRSFLVAREPKSLGITQF